MNKKKGIIFAVLFASLTSIISFFDITLPLSGAHITLQAFMVFLSGAMLGATYGTLAMIIYLLIGVIGLPVFPGGFSGINSLIDSSGGFLLSCPIAAFVIGKLVLVKKLKTFRKYFSFIIMLLLISLSLLYIMGILAIIVMFTGNILIFISVPVASILFLIYLIKKFKNGSLDTIFAMSIGILIIYIMGIISIMFVDHLGMSKIFINLLPSIMGDAILLLLAAWVAERIDINKYLRPSQRDVVLEATNSQPTEIPTTQTTTTTPPR